VLDNCVPRTILRRLPGLGAKAVRDFGWASVDDGPLLDRLEDVGDAFEAIEQNLPFQQRLHDRPFGTIVLCARTNRLIDLLPLIPQLLATIPVVRPGQVMELVV